VVSGSKLFLTVKKSSPTDAPSDARSIHKPTQKPSPVLWEEMIKFLKRHFTDADAKKVLEKMREVCILKVNL
jgi:hypothetical protein